MSGGASKARVIEPDRSQLEWGMINLDADLPADHMGCSLGAHRLGLHRHARAWCALCQDQGAR